MVVLPRVAFDWTGTDDCARGSLRGASCEWVWMCPVTVPAFWSALTSSIDGISKKRRPLYAGAMS